MKSTTKSSFSDDVISAEKTILLDVWAPWCGPCRGMEPILEELSKETKDWAEIVKLDASEEMELAQELGVSGLPTYLIYKNGDIKGAQVGATNKNNLLNLLAQAG